MRTPEEVLEEWAEFLDTLSDEAVQWDGLDAAIVGSVERCGGPGPILCYDYDLMAQVLVARDGLTWEDAAEYLDHNVVCAYVGVGTPFVFRRAPSAEPACVTAPPTIAEAA